MSTSNGANNGPDIDARGSQGAIIQPGNAPITQNFMVQAPPNRTAHQRVEWLKCSLLPDYFAHTYTKIYNATERSWIPFRLWPAQSATMQALARGQNKEAEQRHMIMLKARQLGMSWLCLSYALWLMIFRPAAAIMLFSKRDDEALELRSRIGGMYNRLPAWMQARSLAANAKHEMILSNGSSVRAFPTTGGRSYTGTFVLLDEADFIPNLTDVLNAIKPTVDAGGQLVIISTVDKRNPGSPFKQLFRHASNTSTAYAPMFFPWHARPDRTPEWYAEIARDMRAQAGGSNDDLFQEYPASVEEALAPLELDKRLPFAWLSACYQPTAPLSQIEMLDNMPPALPELKIYATPLYGHEYVMGADPAEGNPNSDPSNATVLDMETWEQIASISIRCEPTVFGAHIAELAAYYNSATILPERNNHGHTLIVALHEHNAHVLDGYDNKPGWLTNIKGKPILYNTLADALRSNSVVIRDAQTLDQLASIEASTLSAPTGQHDDAAIAYALAVTACARPPITPSISIAPIDPLAGIDRR